MTGQFTRDLQFFLGQYDLRLLNPDGLWLLVAIPILFVIGLWMGEELRWWRKVPTQLLRAALVAVLAVAYAQPVRVVTSDAPAVVLLADLSASMDEDARERMETSIRELWSARGRSPTYLVGFGDQPELLAGPEHRRVSLPGQAAAGATDLAAALRFAYGLFPDEHDRRVVLFSDGEQTRGDLLAEVDRARDFDVQLSSVPVLPTARADVRIEGIAAPASTRADEDLDVTVDLVSSASTRARVALLKDGKRVDAQTVRLKPGHNQATFKVSLAGQGWHTLTARMGARADRYPQNNSAQHRVWVFGPPKGLLVQRGSGQNPLRRVLEQGDLRMEVGTPERLSADLAELSKLDLIVLDDLELSKLDADTVDRLRSYVEDYAGGLLVIAGKAASDLADPEEVPIESLLPVQFKQVKKKEDIPAALVFVTDRSSSMARGAKFPVLLRAVADTLERLKDTAQVSVVMFDDFPEVAVPLTEARHRDKIRKVLMAQRVGGGTSMYPALEAAHKQMKKSAAKLKHVILLSDGQSISLYGHYGYIVEKMAADQITVTTVALGQDADQEELKRIAARSGGRFYATDSMENVPKIFTAETENITETNVIEQTVRAVPAKLVQALAGIDFTSSPPVAGYLASEVRPTAEVLLMSSDRSEPLLARWRFGLGRVAVTTTDAQGSWCPEWPNWDGFGKLWPRQADDLMRRSPPGQLLMSGRVEGERGVVTVRVPATHPDERTEPPTVTVIPPRGKKKPLELVRRGLGLYRAEMPLTSLGAYALRAERRGRRGALEVAYASVARSFPEEFLSAGGNPGLLHEAVRRSGGQIDPKPKDVFAPGRQEREETDPLWPPLVLLALGLFLGEVLIRRL